MYTIKIVKKGATFINKVAKKVAYKMHTKRWCEKERWKVMLPIKQGVLTPLYKHNISGRNAIEILGNTRIMNAYICLHIFE